MKWIDNNDNDDKYDNNRHISTEIINSEKTETKARRHVRHEGT